MPKPSEAEPLSELELLAIQQAAKGCVSGTVSEWPVLRLALTKSGLIVHTIMDAMSARELSRAVTEIRRLREQVASLAERCAAQAEVIERKAER